jgi:hypothetical protein
VQKGTWAESFDARALLWRGKLHYNRGVRKTTSWQMRRGMLGLAALCVLGAMGRAQQAPAASGARILLLPRKIVTGERSTLAVLDVNGRLTPGVTVVFSNGDKVTTDATGRALFVAPLNPGVIFASLEGRAGRVTSVILLPEEVPSSSQEVTLAPRVATVSDRFELSGHGFCGDADANKVNIDGAPGLVLAASPAYLAVLPPAEMNPGRALVEVSCGPRKAAFTVLFVGLELEASGAALAPGEHRELTVRVRGSTQKIKLEARNLAPDVADLQGGTTVRVATSGGADNLAHFALQGKQHGSFLISIRLIAPLVTPGP